MIRPAAEPDLLVLQDIERAAGLAFTAVGMAAIAADDPPSPDNLRGYVTAGRAWVADRDGRVAGYLLADVVDGCAHVEQVSVHPDWAGLRIGAALIEHLADWAREHGLPALTLTTFTAVPWNAPYYARLGFHPLATAELGPGLAAVRAAERARGLDRWPRTAMRRDLAAPAPTGSATLGP